MSVIWLFSAMLHADGGKMEQSAEKRVCHWWNSSVSPVSHGCFSACSRCGSHLLSQWRQWPQPSVKRFPPKQASLIKPLCSSHNGLRSGSGAWLVLTLCPDRTKELLTSEALMKTVVLQVLITVCVQHVCCMHVEYATNSIAQKTLSN